MRDEFTLRKLKQLGKKLGYRLIDTNKPAELFVELGKYREENEAVKKSAEHDFLAFVIHHYDASKAQIFQDLFVLFILGEKRDGYFVEFGATNGITLSNTYLLENSYGWKGVLAEPARSWHEQLRRNRKCITDTRCVWSQSGARLEFNEVAEGELSTIEAFSNADGHSAARKQGEKYDVQTISLNDLLESCGAPHCIDYLSVDTEGSELTILSNFDFSKYDIRIITVEHNFTPEREKIHALLRSKGYIRTFEGFSQWDDWYIKAA
jgi:FkbM family methyltransferase